MLFYSVVIGWLLQVMSIQGFSGNEMLGEVERADISDSDIWSKKEFEYAIPDGYPDWSKDFLEKEQVGRDLLKSLQSIPRIPNIPRIPSIAKEAPDLKNFFLEIKSYTKIPIENGTIDIQSFLDEIESDKISPVETVTLDLKEFFNDIESDTAMPDIRYEIRSGLNGPYRSIYTARGIAGVIGLVLALICAPFVIYKRYKARKDLKLRVFVISRKSEKKEPSISV